MVFPIFRIFFHFLRCAALVGVLFSTAPALQAANGVTDADIRSFGEQTETEERSTKQGQNPEFDGWRLFFQAMGSLALVLGLIGAIAFVLKRYAKSAQLTSGRADAIRIVGTKMLGGRRCLMLVRVRGQTLLLGVTPQSINCLTEIHEIEGEWVQPSSAEGAAVPGAFERQLGKFVNETIPSEKSSSRQG